MARNLSAIASVTSGAKRPNFAKLKRTSKTFKRDFDTAMYYAHYELSAKKLKANVLTYIRSQKLDHKSADHAPNDLFTLAGKPCYILNNGGEVQENWEEYVSTQIPLIIQAGVDAIAAKKAAPVVVEKTPAKVISIQDRLKAQASVVGAEFDGWVDEFITDPSTFKSENYKPHDIMMIHELKAGHAHHIIKMYVGQAKEIEGAIKGECDQLKEAYELYTKPQLKRLLKFYESILHGANLIIETSKTTRKPRQRKAVSADKLIEKLKFKKDEPELSLVSANPRDIIGAKELWVYNTKTRKIGRYVALDGDGLSVKSATITNVDEKASVEKTLRKPKEQIKAFKKAGKVALRKYMDEIKTMDTKLKSRLNEHHILLKIVK